MIIKVHRSEGWWWLGKKTLEWAEFVTRIRATRKSTVKGKN